MDEKLAVGIITNADKYALLNRRWDTRQWQLPGGRVKPGEVPAQAVIREIHEELDIAVTALHCMHTDYITRGGTNYFYELFHITSFEGEPHVKESRTYMELAHHNLLAVRIGEVGLSPIAEQVATLLASGTLHLE